MLLRFATFGCLLVNIATLTAAEPRSPQRKADDAAVEFYEKRVRPILAANCYECHGDDEQEAGLSTTSIAALLRGGDQGPAIVPGDPDESLLIQGIRYDDSDFKMPPKAKLSSDQIQTLTQWVKDGALGPDESQQQAGGAKKKFDLAERAKHWCFQPLNLTEPPQVRDAAWLRLALDRYVLAKLEEKQLHPSADADPRTLIRRVYFDLVGLPPTVEEVEAFCQVATGGRGSSDDAYAAVVDKLLASPHFGERWGRHWLDLVRYAETRGHEFDPVIPNAFQYRDYVIRALNADVPYDLFVREHLAGDVLPQPRLNPENGANESVLGTGFWWLGEEVHSPVDIRQDETDRVDNKIDVLSKTFLGLTLACARCHDHKFDALSTKDYYALSGFALSMSYRQAAFDVEAHNLKIYEQVKRLEIEHAARLVAAQQELWQPILQRADKYLLAVRDVLDELRREGKRSERASVITATANEYDLDDERLSAWVTECERNRNGIPAMLVRAVGAKPSQPVPADSAPSAAPSPRVVYDAAQVDRRLWLVDGLVFGNGAAQGGELRFGTDPARPIERVFDNTAATADPNWDVVRVADAETDPCRLDWQQANRTLKTPTFTLETGKLAYYVRGSVQIYAEVASHRVNRGPLHGRLVLSSPGGDDWRWIEHDLSAYVGQRVHLEFSPHEAKKLKPEQTVEFALRGVIERPNGASTAAWSFDPPAPPLVPTGRSGADVLRDAAQTLGKLSASSPELAAKWAVADWMLQHPEMFVTPSPTITAATAGYFARRAELTSQLRRTTRTAPAAFEGTGVDEFVLVRGQHKSHGDLVPRRYLEAIDGAKQPQYKTAGGRLELAERLLDGRNALPARVMVNRIWYHLLGRGIVKTVDNFGIMGDAPTHPELLDHLTAEFMADGWSLKRLIRRIVLSSTYRQSSAIARSAERGTRNDVAAVDPNNELLHRANIKRLDAEIVRDALLAVSGRLNRTVYGPSVEVHLTEFMEGRGRPGRSGPLDGEGRRSIYLRVRRNFLNPLFQAFDFPTPFTAIGRRTSSNVPAQALALLNGPLVGEMAASWAKRVTAESVGYDDAARIDRLYREAFCRPPTADETTAARDFLQEQRSLYAAKDGNDPQAWGDLCHVLFNVKEFIFIP